MDVSLYKPALRESEPGRQASFDRDMVVTPDLAVELLEVGGRTVLFHASRQQIFELNEGAAAIWTCLADGESVGTVTDRLVTGGATIETAGVYVTTVLTEWLNQAWLVPLELTGLLAQGPIDQLTICLCGGEYTIDVFGSPLRADILTPFQGLAGQGVHRGKIVVVNYDHHAFVHAGGYFRGRYDATSVTPAIKACLTEQLIEHTDAGFFAHGALVERQNFRLYLAAEPGGGKSTLAAALVTDGFDVLTDDLVHVDRGLMDGVPFAIALKTGAWPLLMDALPQLASRPALSRADGQSVVYVEGVTTRAKAGLIDGFIALHRQPHAIPSLEVIDSLQALKLILQSGYSAARAISAPQLRALAATVTQAGCYALHYTSLDDARRLLRGLAQR